MASSSLVKAVVGVLEVAPCQAVPATIDALLLATSTHPSLIMSALVDHLSQLLEESTLLFIHSGEKDDFVIAFLSAIVHLFNIVDNKEQFLPTVVWAVCVPLLQQSNASRTALCNIVTEALVDVFSSKLAWSYAEEYLFPYLLKTIHLILWREKGPLDSSETELCNLTASTSTDESRLPSCKPLALHEVCRVLAMLVIKASDEVEKVSSKEEHFCTPSGEPFCIGLIMRFFHPMLRVISQTSNDTERHCPINLFLPPALKAIYKFRDRIPVERVGPLRLDLWDNLRLLFGRGFLQRQDAYSALDISVRFLLFPYTSERNVARETELEMLGFDILNETEFWNIVKSGLVDRDQLTRKRAVHILKEVSKAGSPCQFMSTQSLVDQKGLGSSFSGSFTKRDTYAALEARSLGLWDHEIESWKAFFLLYDMLEEYGTHLVEAVWKNQISVLLPTLCGEDSKDQAPSEPLCKGKRYLQNLDTSIWWVSVLWERGFAHDNPQVRRLILQSFMELEWAKIINLAHVMPESFVLSSLVSALNDPIHHKDFGVKGLYSSQTAKAAARFFNLYSMSLGARDRTNFLIKMAGESCTKQLCRPGFMTLMMCLEAAAYSDQNSMPVGNEHSVSIDTTRMSVECDDMHSVKVLDSLGLLIEESKSHFNPKYRLKACCHLLQIASNAVVLPNIQFKKFFWFLGLFPQDFIGSRGMLHNDVWVWLRSTPNRTDSESLFDVQTWMTEGLHEISEAFIKPAVYSSDSITDEDVETWTQEADKWARVASFGFLESKNLSSLMTCIHGHAAQIYQRAYNACIPEKLLILLGSILRLFSFSSKEPETSETMPQEIKKQPVLVPIGSPLDVIQNHLHSIISANMDEFLAHAQRVSSAFWINGFSCSATLPNSVTGKLGGPSQRRLPMIVTSSVLKGIIAVTTVADCICWACKTDKSQISDSAVLFVWEFAWKAVTLKEANEEMEAEVCLSIFEALASIFKALALSVSPIVLSLVNQEIIYGGLQAQSTLDILTWKFLETTNRLLHGCILARSRRAVLLVQKWYCLDGLLSIPLWKVASAGNFGKQDTPALSDSILKNVFFDAISSLESAGDVNMLPLLRCVRSLLYWGVLGRLDVSEATSESKKVLEVVWSLVRAAWTSIADSNKRKVASIAAFLSAIIHPSIFHIVSMHDNDGDAGPLKWLLGNLLDQGSRSPRTMRLTSMHVAGMWLRFPAITQYYIEELKLLSLHGGESIDEELDGQISENLQAAREYLSLMQSLDPELIEEFRNSEQYVRVTIAVLIHKLAEIVDKARIYKELETRQAAVYASTCGMQLLLSLLKSLAHDKDLSKELYKRKSAIHRRKVRAWQMVCILSQFIEEKLIWEVMDLLQICLLKNNLPSVRQYAEIFGVQLCLRFPYLIKDRILPNLRDYNLKTQALASCVFIAVNVLIHAAPQSVQNELLQEIMPAVMPYLTTHHHPLRSFSQILMHEVFHKILKLSPRCGGQQEDGCCSLENKCLQSIVSYLDGNVDCRRIRVSVGKFLSMFDPRSAATPRGIFSIHNGGEEDPSKPLDDIPFECAPVALMDQVSSFLNEAREDLRQSMAADANTLHTEEMAVHHNGAAGGGRGSTCLADGSSDFQRKMGSLRFSETSCTEFERFQENLAATDSSWMLSGIEKEDALLLTTMHSRLEDLVKMRGNRQELIVVATLLGRIPNLAGLVRTCEVFKASSLILADASVTQDKQFQLISVTAEMWVPIKEVPEASLQEYLAVKMKEGYTLVGLEQTANSISLEDYKFQKKTVLVLGREKEGIPVNILQTLDACVEIPQLGVIRSLNVHVSGAIALWEYTRQFLNI
ncbi:hypothetical protein GOP47_0004943 [Adiantum capillus-veneris]|uniref:tRNA (guanosine(18)-2'-O)-methyltransferase TARBP1 n=1 Tax=Adiantum capillus-veneris TaxID=13818 RepID=A0A9D4ZL47_ADICA|nr:hypothetical protein GOP47_0004943 [Adiantum capillus-veneris]